MRTQNPRSLVAADSREMSRFRRGFNRKPDDLVVKKETRPKLGMGRDQRRTTSACLRGRTSSSSALL